MPSAKSGGDPPQQHLLDLTPRLAPRGLVAKNFLHEIGVANPVDVAKKLARAKVDLVPSGEAAQLPAKVTRRPAQQPAEPKPVDPPLYTDAIGGGFRIGPAEGWFGRKRTGPAELSNYGLLHMIGDISRRYHLLWVLWRLLLAACMLAAAGDAANHGEKPPKPVPVIPDWPTHYELKIGE